MKNETRRAQWEDRLQQWRKSGLSQRAFARLHGLQARQMRYWTSVLTEPDQIVEMVPVRVKDETTANTSPSLTLHSPSGWRVTIPPNVPAGWLGELLQGLR